MNKSVVPVSRETNFGKTQLHVILFNYADKYILNVLVDDVMDTTLDLPISSHGAINQQLHNEEDLAIEPQLLVGDPANLKIQIVAAQIGKVIMTLAYPKNTVLTIGSRWFGSGTETREGDFEKLMVVLEAVKGVLEAANQRD